MILDAAKWQEIRDVVHAAGWADDIAWQESVQRPGDAETFALETCWVILNSGMSHRVTSKVWPAIRTAIREEAAIPFGHVGKVAAMQDIWARRDVLWRECSKLEDDALVEWCAGLPWIGNITKFHVAKNCGADVCKPDVWIQRAADAAGVTPLELCTEAATAMGCRVATADLILWAALKDGHVKVSEFAREKAA